MTIAEQLKLEGKLEIDSCQAIGLRGWPLKSAGLPALDPSGVLTVTSPAAICVLDTKI